MQQSERFLQYLNQIRDKRKLKGSAGNLLTTIGSGGELNNTTESSKFSNLIVDANSAAHHMPLQARLPPAMSHS